MDTRETVDRFIAWRKKSSALATGDYPAVPAGRSAFESALSEVPDVPDEFDGKE